MYLKVQKYVSQVFDWFVGQTKGDALYSYHTLSRNNRVG